MRPRCFPSLVLGRSVFLMTANGGRHHGYWQATGPRPNSSSPFSFGRLVEVLLSAALDARSAVDGAGGRSIGTNCPGHPPIRSEHEAQSVVPIHWRLSGPKRGP